MRKLATVSFSFTAAVFLSRYALPYSLIPVAIIIAAALTIAAAFTYAAVLPFVMRRSNTSSSSTGTAGRSDAFDRSSTIDSSDAFVRFSTFSRFIPVSRIARAAATIYLRALLITIALTAGFVWSWAYTAIFIAPADVLSGEYKITTAVVRDFPTPTRRGYRVDVRITGDVSIGARLYYYGENHLEPGDVIEFKADFRRTDGTDGGERIDALSSRGAFLSGYVSGDITVTGSKNSFLYIPARLANSLAGMTLKLFPDDVAPFMRALVSGKQDMLNNNAALSSSLSAAGVTHIVAISGMHVAFIMGFLSTFLKNKRFFAMIGIPVLLIFMAMTGFTPSVSRAGIMQLFLICAPLIKRERDGITSLSASLLVLLIINPYSCASVGLQLSFAATLGMLLFTGRINYALTNSIGETKLFSNRISEAVTRFVISGFAATMGATVLTVPLTALYFNQVSIISPISNLLILWAVSIAFPIGVLACIFGFIFLPIGSVLAFPATLASRYIIGCARFLSSIPFSSAYTSNPLVVCWLVYIYAVFITLPLLKARIRQYILPVCLALVTLCAVLILSRFTSVGDTDMSISVLSVGQGQSVVLNSGEFNAVIDCGSSSYEDAGIITHEFFLNQGVTSIELLILTHFHSDHVNGVEFLLSRMNVSAIAIPDPDDSDNSFYAEDIIELARRRGTDIIYVTQTLSVTLGNMELIIYPPLGSNDENERGLSVLSLGSLNSLVTGDMSASGERALLRYADLPDIDLLVVGHHGSRFSTSEELLSALTPEVAVISVGDNSYGHPADDTLRRLAEYSVAVHRTDIEGHVTIRR